jgi:hypothetical protein
MATIEENLGIPVDHWVRVNYEGFAKVVDTLGGVDMTVPCRVNLRYKPPTSVRYIILRPELPDGWSHSTALCARPADDSDLTAHAAAGVLEGYVGPDQSPDILPKIGAMAALKIATRRI